jgi:ferredoxin
MVTNRLKKDHQLIKINAARCDLCGTCVGVCPENVISLSMTELSIDHAGCTRCCKCIWICPVTALEMIEQQNMVMAESS